jgi:hypothetical protein
MLNGWDRSIWDLVPTQATASSMSQPERFLGRSDELRAAEPTPELISLIRP